MQKVEIRNLNNNPGILPFKLGTARIKIASHTFLHYIPIYPIRSQITSLTAEYHRIGKFINNTTPYHRIALYSAHKHLEYEINNVNQKLISIFPPIRSKRGLVNPIGSFIKSITGNMDQEDAKEISVSISQLESSQNKVIRKVNKQISLSTKLIQNINETMSSLSRNQDAIASKINEIGQTYNDTLSSYEHYLGIQEILNQIKLNLDSLLSILSDIENAISFANLKTLHHSIVAPEDLKEITRVLYQEHSYSQLLFHTDQYLEYYKVVTTNIFYVENKIVFSLEFPLVHPDTFNHYHLYSIPNSNLSTIIPPSTFLTLSNELYQYQEDDCTHLHPNYLCEQKNLQLLKEKLDCVTSILSMQTNSKDCRQVPIKLVHSIIEEIDEAHYICIFPESQKIQSKCNENGIAILKGTYLLVVPPKCSISTAKTTYQNDKTILTGHPITLEDIHEINVTSLPVHQLKLEKISLDKLHEIQLQEIEEEPLQEIEMHQTYHQWSLGVLSFLVLFILSYITFTKRQIFNKKKKNTTSNSTDDQGLNETRIVPPSSSF